MSRATTCLAFSNGRREAQRFADIDALNNTARLCRAVGELF
jgi:hypothetical protein